MLLPQCIDAFKEAVRQLLKTPEPRPDELFAGAPKPSTVLVELICADWIKNGVTSVWKDQMCYRRDQVIKTSWYSVVVTHDISPMYSDKPKWKLTQPDIELTDHEVALLKAAKSKAEQLQRDRDVAEREARGQEAALKAIEKYLGLTGQPPALASNTVL